MQSNHHGLLSMLYKSQSKSLGTHVTRDSKIYEYSSRKIVQKKWPRFFNPDTFVAKDGTSFFMAANVIVLHIICTILWFSHFSIHSNKSKNNTVFENLRKCLIQDCERTLDKSSQKMPNSFWQVFVNLKFAVKQCY